MTGTEGSPSKNQLSTGVAFTAAKVFALVGVVTLVAVALAIIAGLWLDAQMETKPLFTVIFVLASVPVSFFVIIRLTLTQIKQLRSEGNGNLNNQLSEGDYGRD